LYVGVFVMRDWRGSGHVPAFSGSLAFGGKALA